MNRTAITAIAVATLVGGLLLVAGPAAADDTEECVDGGAAEACVVDDRSGDAGDGDATCAGYRGFTGANASHESDAGAYQAEAGGEETCKAAFFGQELRSERIFADASGEGPAGETDVLVEQKSRSFNGFQRNETTARAEHQRGQNRTWVEVEHRQFGDRCRLFVDLFVDVEPYRYRLFSYGDCPEEASPRAPPNPGWGNVLP